MRKTEQINSARYPVQAVHKIKANIEVAALKARITDQAQLAEHCE